ncbi:hypothetical protein JHL18_00025 [Clostridium sp. YIM B02505]|uniref:Uncharacterized protein n=1 Tax=Clostridium yunnanense TaxID=2800325 RepID=A0ABS1EI28_9CLOT|nr:hypothetical protein [Clostridium yunnanense]MBK1809037.1 hypothetical protein [Clostridium yunnanense]
MKRKKFFLAIPLLIVLYIVSNFVYTMVYLDKYQYTSNGNILFEDSVYVYSKTLTDGDKNMGKTIGTVKKHDGVIENYFSPTWVRELKDDKQHNKIVVRGLMDFWAIYERQNK